MNRFHHDARLLSVLWLCLVFGCGCSERTPDDDVDHHRDAVAQDAMNDPDSSDDAGPAVADAVADAHLEPADAGEPPVVLPPPPPECVDVDAVFEGDFVIETAQDLERLAQVRRVSGDLTVALAPIVMLPCLRRIDGALTVRDARTLTRLSLPALVRAGGISLTRGPSQLEQIILPLLTQVDADFDLIGTVGLTTLTIGNLQTVGGALSWQTAFALTELQLDSLRSVEGSVFIGPSGVTTLILPGLLRVEGDFEVNSTATGPDGLRRLELPTLRRIGRDLAIRFNGRLEEVEAPNLRVVGGALRVEDNGKVTVIALPGLERIEKMSFARPALSFSRNRQAEVLTLPSLTHLTAPIEISAGAALERIELPLLSVSTDIEITENPALHTIDAPRLTAAGGVVLDDNAAIRRLSMGELQTLGGDLWIQNNDALEEVDLGALLEVEGDIRLYRNPGLVTLTLPKVERVLGIGVSVRENTELVSFAMPALTAVANLLSSDCPRLATLSMPKLREALKVDIFDAPGFERLEFPELARVHEWIGLRANEALVSVSLPVLTRLGPPSPGRQAGLSMEDNPVFLTLDAPRLCIFYYVYTFTCI